MSNVKTENVEIQEFLDTPLTKLRSRAGRVSSSNNLLLWINVWLCLIMVILLFQTIYPIMQAHRAEQKVEEYFERLGKVGQSMDLLETAFEESP